MVPQIKMGHPAIIVKKKKWMEHNTAEMEIEKQFFTPQNGLISASS